jgi:probable rRNA maturation factor
MMGRRGTQPSDKMDLVIVNQQHTRKINLPLLKQITTALLKELEIEKAEIGICLIGAAEMTRLNETFLKHQGSTDVMAFDYGDNDRVGSRLAIYRSPLPADGAHGVRRFTLRGEILVCVDEAVLQARRFSTSWQSEIVRYIVHGVLHLLGFDDSSAGTRRKMKREENRLLREIIHHFSLSKL